MRTPAQRKAALEARRAAVQARLARARSRPRPQRREARKRPWWLLLLLLLVLLLAWFCCCSGSPPEVVPPPAPAPEMAAVPSPPPEPPPAPLTGQVAARPRPAFQPPPSQELPWLAELQLQVSSRSPRLAACFVGVQRPGTLKWTAMVEPSSGRVSDHTLEPTLQSDPLTQEQRACVLDALSAPPYRLSADEVSTPSRVGLAIEF